MAGQEDISCALWWEVLLLTAAGWGLSERRGSGWHMYLSMLRHRSMLGLTGSGAKSKAFGSLGLGRDAPDESGGCDLEQILGIPFVLRCVA